MGYLVLFSFIVVAMFLFEKFVKVRRKAGVRGLVTSQDLDGRGTRVYRDHRTGISAKPDIVESSRVIEYKSTHVKKPRSSHVHQVAAEMIAAGKQEAEIRYGNGKRFRLNKQELEKQGVVSRVLRNSERMRWHLRTNKVPKATPSRKKCCKCSVRSECSDAIA